MNTKKLIDTKSIIVNMLRQCEERLSDKSYSEIWPDLELRRIMLRQNLGRINRVLQTDV